MRTCCASMALLLLTLPRARALQKLAVNSRTVTTASTQARELLSVVQANNNAAAAAKAARLFVVEDTPVGRVLEQSAAALGRYPDVFEVSDTSVTLRAESGSTVEARTEAVAAVLADLRAEKSVPMLDGWRDEAFAIRTSFFDEALLHVERAAAGLFGCPAYGTFINGYKADADGLPTHMWIGRRSATKQTWPGLLDCLAAGGIAAGEMPVEATRKEAMEEAGLPEALLDSIRPSGGVCYNGFDATGWALKRDVLYTFDLRCPDDFVPEAVDGEVESFQLVPMDDVARMVARQNDEELFKPNVAVVIIDFLVRRGLVSPDDDGYLELLAELRNAECR